MDEDLRQQILVLKEQSYLRGKLAVSLADQRDDAIAERDQVVRDLDRHAFLAGFSEGLSRKRLLELFFAAVIPLARSAYDEAMNTKQSSDAAIFAYENVIIKAITECDGKPAQSPCMHSIVVKNACIACGAAMVPIQQQALGTSSTNP